MRLGGGRQSRRGSLQPLGALKNGRASTNLSRMQSEKENKEEDLFHILKADQMDHIALEKSEPGSLNWEEIGWSADHDVRTANG